VGGWPFVNGLNLSSDGNYISVGMKSAMVAYVRVSDGKIMWTHDTGNFDDAYISPDGQYVATFSGKQYDAATGEYIGRSSLAVGQFTSNSKYICRMSGKLEMYPIEGVSKLYSSPFSNLDPNNGQQPQWMYLSANDSLGVVAGRDMNNPPKTGIAFFGKKASITSYADDLKNNNSITLKCYPNPFSIKTILKTNIYLKDATLVIYNSLGLQVKQIKNIKGQSVTLSRDNLPIGLYFIWLTEENKSIAVDKLVITN
jgi:hypothetical protein